jgi:hypothetical protein
MREGFRRPRWVMVQWRINALSMQVGSLCYCTYGVLAWLRFQKVGAFGKQTEERLWV